MFSLFSESIAEKNTCKNGKKNNTQHMHTMQNNVYKKRSTQQDALHKTHQFLQ